MSKPDIKMKELMKALDAAGIAYRETEHPIKKELEQMPNPSELVKNLVSPIHLFVGEVSIIYGEVAFNHYELMGGKFNCDRYETAAEVVKALSRKPTQVERLKQRGYYGSVADPQWNKETQRHDCCGSPRSYYHRTNCPLCREI